MKASMLIRMVQKEIIKSGKKDPDVLLSSDGEGNDFSDQATIAWVRLSGAGQMAIFPGRRVEPKWDHEPMQECVPGEQDLSAMDPFGGSAQWSGRGRS